MRKSVFMFFFLSLFALSASVFATSADSWLKDDRPNIIFIYADDLGWTDLSSWGSDYYETPHIDLLASKGVMFTRAYGSPNCAPSRAALLNGQYSPRTGIYAVKSGNRGKSHYRKLKAPPNSTVLSPDVVTWAERLKDAGYATVHLGKWHLGGRKEGALPTDQGFLNNYGGNHKGSPSKPNRYFADSNGAFAIPNLTENGKSGEYLTDRLTSEAISWIGRNANRPFFVYFSHFSVHTPLQAKSSDIKYFKNKKKGKQHNNPIYAAMIKSLDDSVGKLINYLETTDIDKGNPARGKLISNTVIVFYSDNGGLGGFSDIGIDGAKEITRQFPLKAGKGSLYEGGVRVPMVIRWDGHLEQGTKNEIPITHVDWYPTFLELAGLSPSNSHALDGMSIVPKLYPSKSEQQTRPIFWHYPGYLPASSDNGTWRTTPVTSMVHGNWKLLYFYESGKYELYNLSSDIGEKNNLVISEPDLLQKLSLIMHDWLIKTKAPLPLDKTTMVQVSLPPV